MGASLYDDLLRDIAPRRPAPPQQRRGLYDDLIPPASELGQPPVPPAAPRKSLPRDVLDFEETGDVVKGLARAGSGMLSAVGEGGTRLLASGADAIGLDRAAENMRRQADLGVATAPDR